jgi:hypothetical protein
MTNNYSVSSYWLDDDFSIDNVDDVKERASLRKDPIRLNAYRNAVANFVRIVTGEPIKVRFEGKDSYTDGKTVTIGTSLKDKDFDPAVGLALHEGSHIKLTDFDVLADLDTHINKHDEMCIEYAKKYGYEERWQAVGDIKSKVADLLNIVEDRRIDHYVYTTAPGYQGYYQSLYDKYFNAKIVDKGLQSSEYRSEDWDSYFFRIINITNKFRDLNALKGLRAVWELLDLKNIQRLQSTKDSLDVAIEIFKVIESHVPAPKNEGGSDQPQDGNDNEQDQEGQSGNGNSDDNQPETPEGEAPSDDGSKADGDDAKGVNGTPKPVKNQTPELSDRQKKQLEKAIQKQEEFNKGKIKKTKISKKLENLLNSMENAGVEEVEVDLKDGWQSKHKVIVINNFDKQAIDNIQCDMWSTWGAERNKENVNAGLRLGSKLGKKLKVRAEERSTKFNRQYKGRIDKRMIASAGFGMENIFQKIESFSYSPGIVHMSIDNSGSMNGSKMRDSVKTATAIAKACSMIENMDCVISYRAGSYFEGSHAPVMLIAYDSRRHSIQHLKTMMPFVSTSGSTPEGLCFDAIMKEIVNSSRGKDAYFINFSDGQPYYNGYSGERAYKHTRSQVRKMVTEGIKVISYFISNGSVYKYDREAFNAMYGKDASFIDINQISAVARTMNNKFLEKA